MQSRYWLSTHSTFEEAKLAKEAAQEAHPDNTYQIRAGKARDRDVFRLVQRLKNNEVKVLEENRRPKKRKKQVDVSWIKER